MKIISAIQGINSVSSSEPINTINEARQPYRITENSPFTLDTQYFKSHSASNPIFYDTTPR